jgi:predicted amidohydrolase YtcJ
MRDGRPGGLSRRDLLKCAAGAAGWAGGGLLASVSSGIVVNGAQRNDAGAELVLVNGKFVDGRGVIASTLAIRNGRIVRAGEREDSGAGSRRIDLGGRTVVPGLFDAHVHYLRAGVNPGFEARRIERAFSIAELQEAIAQRAALAPPGAFITCIGGWNHTQLAERRRPTRAELDEAAPKHAVYISGTGGGTGALTNSLGRAFLAGKGVVVDETSGLVGSAPAAVAALQSAQTSDDKRRGTADLNRHANSLGLTGVINAGNTGDQDQTLQLWREGKLTVRIRQVLGADNAQEAEIRGLAELGQPGQTGRRDDLFKVVGFGERLGGMNTMSPQFEPTAGAIAKHGWLLQQHSITIAENDFHLAAFRAIAREFPLGGLRWSLLHLQQIDAARLQALKDLGVGASAQTWTYLSEGGGPPFRRILEAGIRAGVGTDSTNVSALDPWLALFYMTTGRNLAGALTNDGQQISRLEALRLYTEGAAYFSFDDQDVGSFAPGKYADLAVLSHDYLTVPEQTIRKIDSVLTLVGGRVVHATGTFAGVREQN